MNWLVIGVDPGPVPGIVALRDRDDGPQVVQCNHGSALLIVLALLDNAPYARQILAVERFVVGPRAARSRTPKAGATTRELINELRLEVERVHGADYVERPAGTVKPWATDTRLDAAGLLAATKGMIHARDAARHALFAAVHADLMPDPLSRVKHWGNGVGGIGLVEHRGTQDNCPAPECGR